MLWYKAWLETRLRFLICLSGMTMLCVYNVWRRDTGLTSPVNDAYYYSTLHGVTSQFALFWLLAVNLTTMGGLLREKAVGAASFTMALPFSRTRLAGVQIAGRLAEALAMIAIPWAALNAAGYIFGKMSPLQAVMHLAFLIGGGVVYFAIALFASSLVEGEYTAPLISLGAVVLISNAFEGPGLAMYNPLGFMTGGNRYRGHEGLLAGSIPWMHIAIFVAIAAGLALASVKAIRMREF